MKVNKYIGFMTLAATMLAVSCSEYDDYNTVPVDVQAGATIRYGRILPATRS